MSLSNSEGSSKKIYFLKVKEGALHADGDDKPYNTVEGLLKGVSLIEDLGNEQRRIKPYTALVVTLEDEDNVYRIKAQSEITFSWILGKFLPGVAKGDEIKLKVTKGKDPVVSIPYLYKKEEGEYVKVPGIEFPEDKQERYQMLLDVVRKHPAYYEPRKN